MMYSPKRLHPIALLLNIIKNFKELIIPLILYLILDREWDTTFLLIMSILFAIIACFIGFVKWFRFRYWVEDGELRIRYGLFVQQKRYIPFERIQSLNLSESIFHRPFQLVKVTIETAGSSLKGEAEAQLTAIKKEDANAIQEIFHQIKSGVNSDTIKTDKQKEEQVLYEISGKELLILASTSGTAGVLVSGFIAFLFQFGELIHFKKLLKGFEVLMATGIVFVSVIVLIALLTVWGLSVAITVFRYADFTLTKPFPKKKRACKYKSFHQVWNRTVRGKRLRFRRKRGISNLSLVLAM